MERRGKTRRTIMSLLEESSSQKKNYHRLVKLAVTFVVVICYTFIQLRTSMESSSSSIMLDDDSVIVVNSQQQPQLTTTTVMWDNNNNNNGHYLQKNPASVSSESKYNNNNSTIQILSQEDLHPLTVLLLSSSDNTTSNNNNNNNIPNNNNNILLFELGSKSKYHGLGSLTMNILLFDMYFHETQPQRTLVIDQTKLEYYRYNTSLGLYSGWFTTSFPVLDSTHTDLQRVQQELKLYYYYNYHHNRKKQSQSHHDHFVWNPIPYGISSTKNNNNDTINILKISHKTQREWKLGFMKARSVARKYYGLASKQSDVLNWSFNSSLFYRLTKQYCTSIKFTSYALHQITSSNNQLQLLLFDDKSSFYLSSSSSSISESVSGGHVLPPMMKKNVSSSSTTTTTTTTMKSSSVAFHIRQGDKISATNHNWKLHNVNEYISKFKSVLFLHNNNNHHNNNNINNGPSQQRLLSSLKYCFVATDNPDVVIPALAEALINASIPCQLYTLQLAKNTTVNTTTAHDNDNDNDNDDDSNNNNNNNVNNNDRKSQLSTLRLMSELRLLVDATYFVGTFASNVGRLVTLWRGCKVYQNIDPQKFTNHHSHSYGIDTEYWTM